MRRYSVVLCAAMAAVLTTVGVAQACSLDNKPSAYANGVLAVTTRVAPTSSSYVWWAHFTFPHTLRVGQRVLLREDDAQVRKALPSLLRKSPHPWRWRFGDGSATIGDRVTHVYHRPGHYKVSVDVYGKVNGKGEWLTFDSITAAVRR